jgi:hypothetical protein
MSCTRTKNYPRWRDTIYYEDDEDNAWWLYDDQLGTYEDSIGEEESNDNTPSNS